jgi:RND family efflux transporter MFP subunit
VAVKRPGLIGVVTAAESVDIAPRFQGVVQSVRVRAGDVVTVGQVIAEMDPKSVQEELRAAEAALAAAGAARRLAEVDVEDARRRLALETKSVASGVSATSQLDEAKLAVKRAEAAAQQASSTMAAESSHVQSARAHLSDTALRAPAAGTVAMRFKDPGATVAAGTPIVRIVGQSALRIRFASPPQLAAKFTAGLAIEASIDTIATPVAAVVRQVSPIIDPASGLIIVEAEVAPGVLTEQLRPGLAVRVREP